MLYSDARRKGEWHAIFTAEQINAWLAYDLPKLYGKEIPAEIRDPRVSIAPEGITLGMRYEDGTLPVVFSLAVDAYLSDPNKIALRFRNARAGALPFALGSVLDEITRFARGASIPVEWTRTDGDPVALLSLDAPPDKHGNTLVLEALELHDGEIYVSGHTLPVEESSASAEDGEDHRDRSGE
jgi:hypothetical protein